jgi:hypothetical protein
MNNNNDIQRMLSKQQHSLFLHLQQTRYIVFRATVSGFGRVFEYCFTISSQFLEWDKYPFIFGLTLNLGFF